MGYDLVLRTEGSNICNESPIEKVRLRIKMNPLINKYFESYRNIRDIIPVIPLGMVVDSLA